MRQTSKKGSSARPVRDTKASSLTGRSAEGPAERGLNPREVLERWVRAPTTPQRLVRRSRIVLLMLEGQSLDDIAARLGVSRPTVKLWVRRFEAGGPEALLHDAPGRGRHATLDASRLEDQLREAHLLGPDGQPTSLRRAARELGVSTTTLWRALQKHPRAS